MASTSDISLFLPMKRKMRERKEDVIKKLKLKGEAHINHVGKIVPARTIGEDCKCKRFQCFIVVNGKQRQKLFTNFYNLQSKDIQDSYLADLIDVEPVKQRRSRLKPNILGHTEPGNKQAFSHSASFNYRVKVDDEGATAEYPICRMAFTSFHGITRGRLRTVQHKLLKNEYSPKDHRGKHNNRPRAMPEELDTLVQTHITSLKPHNPTSSVLTVSDMHKLFIENYQIHMPYKCFWRIFHENFSLLSFGTPQVAQQIVSCSYSDEDVPSSINNGENIDREKLTEESKSEKNEFTNQNGKVFEMED